MFEEIEQIEGKDTDISAILTRSIKNIIYILALGERPNDPHAPDVLEEYDNALNDLSRAEVDYLLGYLPFVANIPGRIKTTVQRVKRAKKGADEMMLYGPKRTHIPGQPRGITDLLLDYQKKPGYEFMDEDETHLIGFLTTLFMAAHLTTRSTLTGMFLCLVNYPEVTKKIQQEIDSVLQGQQPRMEHKRKMPYTEAAILDTLRLTSVAPISSFRRASEDLDFEGMTIPKNTMIFINNWHIQHDEKLWEQPWRFNPDHFLDSEGNLLPVEHQIRKNSLPFGIGARACPGEIFARSRVFLFVTSILQRYDLLPPANEKMTPANFKIHDEHIQGLVRQTPPYKCRLVRRKTFYN
ncbi:unnamed protein product [Candidula unifasciata]|uniref:Cytochrome P450 n=1 Tax=Candidula unifasciata TaxID=100452 RepID=A0A8S3ZRS1_9EUPU|nr:unnamed protein product [Candidula unifasciata]